MIVYHRVTTIVLTQDSRTSASRNSCCLNQPVGYPYVMISTVYGSKHHDSSTAYRHTGGCSAVFQICSCDSCLNSRWLTMIDHYEKTLWKKHYSALFTMISALQSSKPANINLLGVFLWLVCSFTILDHWSSYWLLRHRQLKLWFLKQFSIQIGVWSNMQFSIQISLISIKAA